MTKQRHYPLLLLALASPSIAKIPWKNNVFNGGANISSRKLTKLSSSGTSQESNVGAASSIQKILSPQSSPDAQRNGDGRKSAVFPTSHEESGSIHQTPQHNVHSRTSPAKSSTSVSIGMHTSSTISIINKLLSKSTIPLFKCITLFAQFAIAGYVAKATYNVLKEVWDEVNEEFAAARGAFGSGSGSGGEVREEQDLPYANEDVLSGGLGGVGEESDEEEEEGESDEVDENDSTTRSRKVGRRRIQNENDEEVTPQMTATRELAARLRSAGIPYASEVDEASSTRGTVEDIVRSLTRAEGNVLTQTLLTPLDGGLVDGVESPDAAAAAWNSIGGLSDAKESLLDLAFPLLHATTQHSDKSNSYYGGLLANPPGVLLYGPPGCGKNMLVRALAATIGARFLVVSPSCLLRKYVGETNLNVRALFSVAKKISPCVIFVDELDGLFRERGGEDHDVSRDLKTEWLQLWNGIRNHSQGGSSGGSGSSSVLIIGATNRPFDVDPAFLRRMPRRVFVGLPDHDSRISVLQSMLSTVPLDSNFDLNLVASRSSGYSPSDLRELLQAAALYPLREARAHAMSSSEINGKEDDVPTRIQMPPLRELRTDDVLRALQVAKPTHFSKRYQRELMNYVRNSGGTMEVDDPSASPLPSVTDRDTDENYVADQYSYFDDGNADESDEYSYDDDTSESDYDDL